ncbi:MAG: tyrosine-type recombinase/integrase [Thermoproteota archaeon]|nr:tyrosine-type recombinase/integrase [Thermoproteota archaeon]
MQTIKRTTGLRTAAADYETLVQQAINKVTGFDQLYKELERAINVTGKSKSTLTNYSRHLAHLALHYNQLPTELDHEQVLDYLHLVKANGSPSAAFFKFTVYGMRYACKLRGLPYQQFSLPSIERNDKLPVVLNASEVRALLSVCTLLKHRLLIGLAYGCGLRCAEVRQLRLADVDTERAMVHVHQGKGNKDRCLPMGKMLARGIATYLKAEKPRKYLFEGKDGSAYSQRGAQWAISEAVKKAGISKEVTLHTLRHTYATHLLEQGVNILTIKELLGHAHIETTMIYLHLARPSASLAFNPIDTLYNQPK